MAAHPPLHPDAALSLALAVVDSSTTPLLLLDGDLNVVAASSSFYLAFAIEPQPALEQKIFELGAGEWDTRQLRSLLNATVSSNAEIDAYEMDFQDPNRGPRKLILNARKLNYADAEHVRLVLAVADVTDARAAEKLKDDLLREKTILLQEVQHRVANSLQIIASVLLQNARNLRDAHNRVLSVAAVQRQLAVSQIGDVELRGYFIKLCDSLGSSMISDAKQLSIEVTADDSSVKADVSVSLGLIVTELVINALKHAFPGNRHGKVVVDYHARGAGWTLSVTDDGVGMDHESAAKPGLGTSIVEAVARQLDAHITVADRNPGTAVSVIHTFLSVVSDVEAAPAV
jgi:two-component system, sensor histidine kinase PdtaS